MKDIKQKERKRERGRRREKERACITTTLLSITVF